MPRPLVERPSTRPLAAGRASLRSLTASFALLGLLAGGVMPAAAQYQPPTGPAQPGQPGQPAHPSEPQRPTTPWAATATDIERRERPVISPEEMMRLPAVLRLPAEDSAVVRRDLVYRTVGETPLRFDLYLPPGGGPPRGAIVFASGAPDTRGWGVYQSYGRLAAAHGLAGIVYEKRYKPSESLQGIADTEALLDYLRDHGAELGVDPSRIVVWAFSAGGKLLGVGFDPRRQEVRALIGFYPALDASAELPFYPDSLRARVKDKASPADIVEARPLAMPPTLIVRAGLDSPALNSGIARFVRLALEANRPIELINLPRGRHGFDLLDDNDESRRAIRRAFAFALEEVGTTRR